MMLVVCAVFAASLFLYSLAFVLSESLHNILPDEAFLNIIFFSIILNASNSCVNPIIYCFTSTQFRGHFLNTLCIFRRKRVLQQTAMNNGSGWRRGDKVRVNSWPLWNDKRCCCSCCCLCKVKLISTVHRFGVKRSLYNGKHYCLRVVLSNWLTWGSVTCCWLLWRLFCQWSRNLVNFRYNYVRATCAVKFDVSVIYSSKYCRTHALSSARQIR